MDSNIIAKVEEIEEISSEVKNMWSLSRYPRTILIEFAFFSFNCLANSTIGATPKPRYL